MENKPNPSSSIEDLLAQMDETLKVIQNHEGPINLTPELLADIAKLETMVADFKEDTDELFNILDIDVESLNAEILESSNVRSSDKQLIKHADDIKKKARVMKLALSTRQKERGKTLEEPQDKQQMKERRKLFKSIGGDKKWIPL